MPDEHGAEPIPDLDGPAPDEYSTGHPPHDGPPNDREGMSPLTVGILIVLVLLLAAGTWWWLSRNGTDPADADSVAAAGGGASPPQGEDETPGPSERSPR